MILFLYQLFLLLLQVDFLTHSLSIAAILKTTYAFLLFLSPLKFQCCCITQISPSLNCFHCFVLQWLWTFYHTSVFSSFPFLLTLLFEAPWSLSFVHRALTSSNILVLSNASIMGIRSRIWRYIFLKLENDGVLILRILINERLLMSEWRWIAALPQPINCIACMKLFKYHF
jgi:hypothetical protein